MATKKIGPREIEERKQRIVEASWLMLRLAPAKRLNLVPLNEGLFYLDLCALRDLGLTFTKATYLALPYGPVVADYPRRLIQALEERGVARLEPAPEEIAKPIVLVTAPEVVYADTYIETKAAEVFEFVGRMSSTAASDFSHKNPGWRLAYNTGLGGGKRAMPINMAIAMQQILDADAWLAEPLDERELSEIREAEAGPAVPW